MPERRDRAVVLGASMGGLLAARVLADHFRIVTVVERDILPQAPTSRRGVPQDRHPHVLLGKGVQIVGELFPGFFDQLVADGAVKWDDGDLSRFWSTFGGHLMVRSATVPDPASLVDYHVSRPLLEFSVRKAVRAISNVEFLEGHDVVGLTADTDANRITGARLARQGVDGETVLTADLVIDATGRGSRTPVFLEEFGYARPPVEELKTRIAYAAMPVRVPAGMLRELVLTVNPVASRPTTFAMFAVENDTYLVVGGTLGGRQPPADRAELLDFISDFAPRHALAAIRAGEPLGDVVIHRVPSNRWRRYDQLARTPDGLLVLGDAVCSFNPIYGQGMTIAAAEVEILGTCLSNGDEHLPRRFFGESTKTIKVAWRTAVGSDLALPQVNGHRPLSTRIINSYMDAVLTATETDPAVAQQFFRVAWMLDAPARLFRPSIVLRIAKVLITGERNDEQVEHLRQLAQPHR